MPLAAAPVTDRPAMVLTIDGGGIRGIIPAVILAALRQGIGHELCDSFDLISGTSTGGIIALGIGTGADNGVPYTPEGLLRLYVGNGPIIFKPSFGSSITQLWRPRYSAENIESVLQKFFGQTQLSSARTPLLISSYDLQSQLPFFFKSHRIPDDPSYDWPVWQIARATSAAPTFFPPLHLQREQPAQEDYALVDGGIFVNDPAMAAMAEARNLYPDANGYIVVSVGTGDRKDKISFKQCRSWGKLQWAGRIPSVMMDSVEEATDYELRAMAGPGLQYFRLQLRPLEGASPEMDDVSSGNLKALEAAAEKFVQDNQALIDTVCSAVKKARW